jgi:hypothetical protein
VRLGRSVFADCVRNQADVKAAFYSAVRACNRFGLNVEQKCLLMEAIAGSIRVGALVEIEYDRDAKEREFIYTAKSFLSRKED